MSEIFEETEQKRIDGLGRVAIPKKWRTRLDLREDDRVEVRFVDGPDKRIEIRPVDRP
jgi:AbrB family looped-hinge helix DNA binding protein